VMFRADGERRSFSIARDITVIGRREDCDLRIPLGDVSRKHCRIVRDGDMLKLEDLGSSNGTFLNAHRVQEALLSPGDSIQVGPVVFVLQIDGVPADEDLHPITTESAGAVEGVHMQPMAGPPPVPVPPPVGGMAGPPPVPPPMPGAGGDAGADSLDELQPLEELEPIAGAGANGGAEELEVLPMDDEPQAGGPPPLDAHSHNAHAGGPGQEGGFEIVDESHHDDAMPLDHIDLDTEQPHGRA